MKRLKIMKSYVVLWLFIYFLIFSNLDTMLMYFMATLTFNLAVLTVLIIGIIMVMKAAINLVMLAGTFGILAYKKDNLSFYLRDIDKIMPANIAHMFHSRAEKGMLLFTVEESRDVVEWIEEKFSHQNRYTNYFTGTVLMIGLLGTFSGLLIAIDDMGRIILSLSGDIDLAKVISDFSGPLGGMAVGFGSSLFGVISAIILGLMGYILNKNQETLVEGVEDWLKGRIIDSGGAVSADAMLDGDNPAQHKASFMDVFIDNLSTLSTEMGKISTTNDKLHSITVASFQQARNEHDASIDLFEDISASLKNIDDNAKGTSKILSQQFNALQISMNTNHNQLLSQQQDSINKMISKLESALEHTHSQITQKFQEVADSSSKAMSSRVKEISELITAIDEQLMEKQKILLQMQSSGDKNQSKNEDLLEQLISLFKESTTKLDREQETIESIVKELGTGTKNSELHFNGISDLIKSLSSTMQTELSNLDSLQEEQKNQSQIMKDNVDKSKEIHDTLVQSREDGLKQEEQLTQITSKIKSVTELMNENSAKSHDLLNTKLSPISDIVDAVRSQESKLISQQDTLDSISNGIQGVKGDLSTQSSEQAQMFKHNAQELVSKIDEVSKIELENNKENIQTLTQELVSKIDEVSQSELENNKENMEILTESIAGNTAARKSNGNQKSDSFFGKLFN